MVGYLFHGWQVVLLSKLKKIMKKIYYLLSMWTILLPTVAETWENPFTLSNEWPLYSIGDPYVLKYNGVFYLYCSTRDDQIGVKVWSSRNLVAWEYEGLCANDPITLGAYAPEVIHWGGDFYMYTSPGGHGHYVLKSSSPVGPFEVVTNNLGLSIDGSVFKDDNGALFFYRSGHDGIVGHPMTSPTVMGDGILLSSTYMNGWTEGPSVIKRNGIYYMIYTGNHVISQGYRIDVASSTSNPLSAFLPDGLQNPVILSSMGTHVGLGHGSMFRGPNLDEYFITYHNLAGDYGYGPFRHLNFDRISFNGDRLLVHGPTNTEQVVPDMPDYYTHFDSEELDPIWEVSGESDWTIADNILSVIGNGENCESPYMALVDFDVSPSYIAEFNILEGDSESELIAGAVFNYVDTSNYGTAVFRKASNELIVRFKTKGEWGAANMVSLPGVNQYGIFHSIRIEKENDSFHFFVDDMLKLSLEKEMQKGRVGYMAFSQTAKFGFMGVTNHINGSSSFNQPKPIPGQVAASHYLIGNNGDTYQVNNSDSKNSFRNDYAKLDLSSVGGYSVSAEAGEWFTYELMVPTSGQYNVGLGYHSNEDDVLLRILKDGDMLSDLIILPSSSGEYHLLPAGNVTFNKGRQVIQFEVVKGKVKLYDFHFKRYEDVKERHETFNSFFTTFWNYADGDWVIQDASAKATGCAKRVMGSDGWTDYSVMTDIKYVEGMNGGLVVRANNPALGGAGNDPVLGTDFFQGYYVSIENDGVVLGKHNYNYQFLAKSPGTYTQNVWYKLAVTVKGNSLKVFVNDLESPVLEYIDPYPILSGKAGLRTFWSTVLFDDFIVSSKALLSELKCVPDKMGDLSITVREDKLKLFNCSRYARLSIVDVSGVNVLSEKIQGTSYEVNIGALSSGVYLFMITDVLNNSVTGKFVRR